ncbi:MAG: hypothetical protein M1837_003655 [Sclerophora amabilis]|nr:MAG: hypothetical protein M1837_003655 [Sclerophora amabilis]
MESEDEDGMSEDGPWVYCPVEDGGFIEKRDTVPTELDSEIVDVVDLLLGGVNSEVEEVERVTGPEIGLESAVVEVEEVERVTGLGTGLESDAVDVEAKPVEAKQPKLEFGVSPQHVRLSETQKGGTEGVVGMQHVSGALSVDSQRSQMIHRNGISTCWIETLARSRSSVESEARPVVPRRNETISHMRFVIEISDVESPKGDGVTARTIWLLQTKAHRRAQNQQQADVEITEGRHLEAANVGLSGVEMQREHCTDVQANNR